MKARPQLGTAKAGRHAFSARSSFLTIRLVLFATSGMNNVVSARCAIQKSPGSQAGAFITASHVRWVVRQLLPTAFYFIPSAMTGFIVSVFPFRNRVSSKEAFEGLELGERKLSRPVLRGPGGRKVAWLLGS